jgi:hypothetical protein
MLKPKLKHFVTIKVSFNVIGCSLVEISTANNPSAEREKNLKQ